MKTLLLGVHCFVLTGCATLQRPFLFHPSHEVNTSKLEEWTEEGKTLGYKRAVPDPENVWLMLHGNSGQASDREYAIGSFSSTDSVFIMEYPGYGDRPGKPSRASFDKAAREAYLVLREKFPDKPICIAAESIGSGPACVLASESPAPDKIVLLVPYDKLTKVANGHVKIFPVGLLLEANWDNSKALADYKGPVDIFAAQYDKVIPIKHARKLAESVPQANFYSFPGRHNQWSVTDSVRIRN